MINKLKVYNVGEKTRVGSANDGGYVLPLQMLQDSEYLFSYGIADDISFDEHYIQLTNSKVYGYDHTIDGISTQYPELFTWYKKGLSGSTTETTGNFIDHYKELGLSGRALLKVDVEGCEYEWLTNKNTNIEELASITTGIVLEVHNLENDFVRHRFLECIEELNKYFYICHIHGNNCARVFRYKDIDFPMVLELTFISKAIVKEATLSNETFPTELDSPNNKYLSDIYLKFMQ
jgi:hypothetical protein